MLFSYWHIFYSLLDDEVWKENDAMMKSLPYCESCDKYGHVRENCRDFQGRRRDRTNPGTAVMPHFGGQYEVQLLGRTAENERVIRINNRDWWVKRATGVQNNYLIDTQRQCLVQPDGIPLYNGYLELVRDALATYDFPSGPDRVCAVHEGGNFLELQEHTAAVVRRLVEHAPSRRLGGIDATPACWQPEMFKFICVDLDIATTTLVASFHGSREAFFARDNGYHFVPLRPYHGRRGELPYPWAGRREH